MKKIVKSRKKKNADASLFSRLPDEIILQIVNKLIDLKTLCFCYLVSKRLSSIVLQVDTISFTAPLDPNIPDKNTISDVDPSRPNPPKLSSFFGESFLSANGFLNTFTGVKSLYMEFPSFGHRDIDNNCLFKWKVKLGHKALSFIFLSPSSICDKDGLYLNGNVGEEEDLELLSDLLKNKLAISFQCLQDVIAWYVMLLHLLNNLPMLEEVSITDLGRRGRLSLSGKKLREVKEWVHSASETVFDRVEVPDMVSKCYIPVLKLPVSGYVMKGVFCAVMEMKDLHGENDNGLLDSENGFEDKEEAAYIEAMKEVLEKDNGMMQRFM
ncbi:unnamed protein product [Lactuca virosa]|uniref:F-box domain-containing protein n=1 Tax=Lactuca virosa TaxID=75947 RepID=A0AAU9LE53_9ASTR|nr:unnamed protein product [Lactuca virosa]